MNKSVILLLLSLAACGGRPGDGSQSFPDAPWGAVTKVSITGTNSLAFNASTKLSAMVEGTGNFIPEVTWSIRSGGGQLSATTGQTVTYTAPVVSTATPVTIDAVSQMDASKSGTLTLTVTPPPPAGSFMAERYTGSAYQSSQEGNEEGRYDPPQDFTEDTNQTTYYFRRVSDTRVLLYFVMGYPEGIPVDIRADGTLSIPDTVGESRGGGGCVYTYRVGLGAAAGSGTWDYKGNLTLTWSSREAVSCDYHGNRTSSYSYQEHRFTAVRTPDPAAP